MGTGIAPTRIATGHFRVSMSEQFATNVAAEDSRSEFEVLSLPYIYTSGSQTEMQPRALKRSRICGSAAYAAYFFP